MTDYQELLDYRRSVWGMYAGARGEEGGSPPDVAARCKRFRTERDDLFKHHPQSPLAGAEEERFTRLDYFDYDPSLRFVLPVEYDVNEGDLKIILQEDFDYAYNPSCAYDPRWHCPLAPPENNLPLRIAAGEKRYGE